MKITEPPTVNSPFPPEEPPLRTVECLVRIVISILAFTILSDFLLWPAIPGLSWGLFLLAASATLILNRPVKVWKSGCVILLVLLLLTACQSAVEISFSNILVSLVLLAALIGEASYPSLAPGWERGSEAVWALVKVLGRWEWLVEAVAELPCATQSIFSTIVAGIRISGPALFLGVIFAALFRAGNAVFATWISSALDALWRWVVGCDISFGHMLFGALLATISLWILRPSDPSGFTRIWARTIPKLPVKNTTLAKWRSMVTLFVLNSLFFVVNTIDAFYLWVHSKLPAGVSVSGYVHEGVNSLIGAVILSAIVMAVIYQQDGGIGQSPTLKRLGYGWIAQNFILIAGVTHRLMHYIRQYSLTLPRLYVMAFVLVVAAGFILLTIHVAKNGSLNSLILSNGAAVLTLYFVMQFLNISGWVADYNVARWEHDAKTLDVDYLKVLGESAWPALARVADSGRPESREAKNWLYEKREEEGRARGLRNWRSWQGRRSSIAARVFGDQ